MDWKLCPFFYREDSIRSYQECLFNRVIPEYKVHEGGQLTYCRHMDVATLKVSRSHSGPILPAEEKKGVDSSSGLMNYLWTKLQRQFAVSEN